MARIHTHYDNLMVARNASPEVIRAAYKTLSQKYHPDRNPGNQNAIRIIQMINLAYEVLSDPARRQEHDEWIERTEAEEQRAAALRSGSYYVGGPHHASSMRRKSSRRSRNKLVIKAYRLTDKIRAVWDQFSRTVFKKI